LQPSIVPEALLSDRSSAPQLALRLHESLQTLYAK
jgi:hypothetical protein